MQDSVTVALVRPAVGMRRLGMLSTSRRRALHRIRRQKRLLTFGSWVDALTWFAHSGSLAV
jgi:hypothetical protein